MFADLRSFGGLTNREAARILLSDSVSFGGKTPRSRVDERTFLSRQIVHAMPGQNQQALFADFFHSSQTIGNAIASRLKDSSDSRRLLIEHYSGPAAEQMRQTLDLFDLDGTLYANAVKRVLAAGFHSEADRATLLVMLFVTTGCLGDPRSAVDVVERFVEYKLAMDVGTVEMGVGRDDPSESADKPSKQEVQLGLLRVAGDVVRPPIYPLSCSARGTVIGALVDGEGSINDVDVDVSREHLRIWREGGIWFAQGLGSANGSELISGATGDVTPIELPRSQRSRGSADGRRVRIESGDKLRLGATTTFLVMRIAS